MSLVAKRHRLGRLVNRGTGRTVIVALDHGLQHGPGLRGIGRFRETFARIMEGEPDAVVLNPGAVKSVFADYEGSAGLLVKLTASRPSIPTLTPPSGLWKRPSGWGPTGSPWASSSGAATPSRGT